MAGNVLYYYIVDCHVTKGVLGMNVECVRGEEDQGKDGYTVGKAI